MPSLRVAALQLPHRFAEPVAQLGRADAMLAQAGPLDLAVLSECALTGYLSPTGDADLRRFAEPPDGPTSQLLAALARAHRVTLAAPLIEALGGSFYNAFSIFGPDGRRLAHYRKRHPWYVETWATPGDLGMPLFEVAGVLTTIAICFDVHFLEEDSMPILEQAQLLLFPSAWVNDEAVDARDARLPQLARAFGMGIVNANWGEGLPRVAGQGTSRILDAAGQELARTPPDAGVALAVARLSLPEKK